MLTITSSEPITGAEAIPYMRQGQREKLEKRFFSKTEAAPDGCLMWTGGTTGMGYGGFNIRGHTATAHRTALTLAQGPLPAGLLIATNATTRYA